MDHLGHRKVKSSLKKALYKEFLMINKVTMSQKHAAFYLFILLRIINSYH